MANIKASIIIPTKDKLARLRLVLKFLENQMTDEIEVIIVFDGCCPETIDSFGAYQFSFNPLQIICMRNNGRSAARNLGIKLARGKVIIFLDDDRIPGEDFIKQHLEGQKEPCVLLGQRRDVYLTDNEIQNLFFVTDQTQRYRQIIDKAIVAKESVPKIRRRFLFQPGGSLGWMAFFTGNVSVPRKDLIAAGCFDEKFRGWGHEDLELGYRLHKNGVRFQISAILNYHLSHPSNTKEQFRDSRKNLKYMIKKCRGDMRTHLVLRAMLAKMYLERFIDFR